MNILSSVSFTKDQFDACDVAFIDLNQTLCARKGFLVPVVTFCQ